MVQNSSQQLDSRIKIITPENIAFEYRLAGPFWRLPAYLIDLLIRFAAFAISIIAIIFTFSISFGSLGLGIAGFIILVFWFLLSWFYGGLFETYWNGQTPGKRLMGLRVLTTDGQPINALQAVLRNVLRLVDAIPGIQLGEWTLPTYMLGLFTATVAGRYQRLGDIVCRTIVVIEERNRMAGIEQIRGKVIDELDAQIPANFVVSRSLAHVLQKYVERRLYLGPARRQEIASHVGSVLIKKLSLPPNTKHDVLLCTLYRRSTGSNEPEENQPAQLANESPPESPQSNPVTTIKPNTPPQEPSPL